MDTQNNKERFDYVTDEELLDALREESQRGKPAPQKTSKVLIAAIIIMAVLVFLGILAFLVLSIWIFHAYMTSGLPEMVLESENAFAQWLYAQFDMGVQYQQLALEEQKLWIQILYGGVNFLNNLNALF